MSKKKLNTKGIANELSGGASLYFRPTPPRKPAKQKPVSKHKNERSDVGTNERTKQRTKKSIKQINLQRVKIRHTFDIYKDQLIALQTRQLKAVQRGKKKPKLGDMVQKALDMYLNKKSR